MRLRINGGSRPSRLQLGQHRSGETSVDVSHPESSRYLAELDDTSLPRFDFDDVVARSFRAGADPKPAPAWRRALWIAPFVAMAAALLLVARPPENRLKGDVDLDFYVLRDGQAFPGDPSLPVRPGDRLQFTYRAGMADQMVVLGVDGTGNFTQFYPDEGDAPVAVIPGERHVLEGSILLDDAPGPEVFVAFFGEDGAIPVADAREMAQTAWDAEGIDGLTALAEDEGNIALLVLEKE